MSQKLDYTVAASVLDVGTRSELTKDFEPNGQLLRNFCAQALVAGLSAAVFKPLAKRIPAHPVAQGLVFGLGIWAMSQGGWLRLLGAPAIVPGRNFSRRAKFIASLAYGVGLASVEGIKRLSTSPAANSTESVTTFPSPKL